MDAPDDEEVLIQVGHEEGPLEHALSRQGQAEAAGRRLHVRLLETQVRLGLQAERTNNTVMKRSERWEPWNSLTAPPYTDIYMP